MSINSFTLNTQTLNGEFSASGSGSIVSIDQQVAFIGSGALVSVEQAIQLRLSGSGALVDIDQKVATVGSGAIIDLEQKILSAAEVSFFTRNGWDMLVTLGGRALPRDQIMSAEVKHETGDNSTAFVKITPGAGTYDMYQYQGKTLKISARTSTQFKTVFKGIVDIPTADLINEYITINATTDREQLIRNKLTPAVASIGNYSTTVFGTRRSVFQEVQARLETVQKDLDFDPYGNYSLTSWTPKGSADISKGNSDVYYRAPSVRIESSRDVINNVEIKFNYAYQRLHQDSVSYSWVSSAAICDHLTDGNTLPSRNMIRNAAQQAGWFVDAITFTNLWPGGFYTCSGTTIGWVNSNPQVAVSSSGSNDSSGNTKTQSSLISTTDLNNILTRGASWTARKRYSQNIEEQYTLTVKSPQSQTLYGLKESNLLYNLQADFDPSEWEDESKYDISFSGTTIQSAGSANTYYINRDTNKTELANAITTALNKAKTDILKSHRDTEVFYEQFLDLDVQLKHTVSVSTNRVVAKGKVKSIVHRFDASGDVSTETTLLMYRSTGSQAETALNPPSRPSNIAPAELSSISLGSRWGQDPSTTAAQKWTGYVGNKWVTAATGGVGAFGTNTNTYFTTFQESFIVDTPTVYSSKRSDSVRKITSTYNVSIPNDNLSVIFTDS